MGKELLWIKLLDVLEENQQKIDGILDLKSKNDFVVALIRKSLHQSNQKVTENICNIVEYYMLHNQVRVIDLINFFKEKSSKTDFDIITLERETQDAFDEKFGTLTGVIKEQFMMHDLISVERYVNSARYHPTPIKSMHLAIDFLKTYGVKYEHSIFIDIGSGMGRNLLIASEYPFKKIIGIEISEYLNDIATNNINIYKTDTQKCKNINSYCTDVLDFDLPEPECLILYFWEPFDENTFNQFFQKIINLINAKGLKVFLIFLGKVFPEVRKSKHFKLNDYVKSEDKISESEYFYISIFSN